MSRISETPTYPLSLDEQRVLPVDYQGNVFVWDIDKTYLATRFSSLRGLARIPIEFATDKAAIPGMPEVLRGIRRGPGPGFASAPLYFVSASPPQLRKVIERKMLLDGVQFDGITFKDWLGTIRQLRPGRLKDHVGFKLCALLTGRRSRLLATEYLFGDDVEKDAQAYLLYARILQGGLPAWELNTLLAREGVKADDRRAIQVLISSLPKERGKVGAIFIHLEKRTPKEHFDPFGPLLVAVEDAASLARELHQRGLVDEQTVLETR